MSQHTELLSLIEQTGPFLTEPVLDRVFPQGIDPIEQVLVARLRSAHAEWTESQQRGDAESSKIHTTWIDMVLREGLGYEERSLMRGSAVPAELTVDVPEHAEKISPDMVLVNPEGRANKGKARLLISIWPFGQDLVGQTKDSKWAATPIERMVTLCRATGVRLGFVTNGERWTLIDAREGQSTAVASWYARYWAPEPLTLRGLLCLLGARRFFGVPEADTLEALLTESVNYQQEVTDQLGLQVRQAVEVLIQALDRADKDRKRELLRDVDPGRLYDAALTVMMRLVFLFCAEERGLLLLGDPIYDSYYAVSTLRGLLREEADKIGLEVLERRHDAWARLLATFRGIYGGIYHENLRLPALGGSLFDPDRYPFLEGRSEKTSWKDTPAFPLPIDNRTVLHLLESLQLLKKRGGRGWQEARRLSFRALDVEQIGHVYEGLLDHVAVRVEGPTLGLIGAKGQEPEISLEALEEIKKKGEGGLIEFLSERTGRSVSALKNDLHEKPKEDIKSALLTACGNKEKLLDRVLPFQALLRDDVWGYPVIYHARSFMVTGGPERRSTGTHYTPRSLTEEIVRETLIPLVYEGPCEGKPRNEWKLKSPNELWDLKICDMAMGSGAFLVQVCEWLGERVVEAWALAESNGEVVLTDGAVVEDTKGAETLSRDKDERLLIARRLIAEKCIYGVDINPMAVELAKLSIWLVTMAKGRPFGFLDHNLKSGDSLLGIFRLDQLTQLSMRPDDKIPTRLFGQKIKDAVEEAIRIRKKLREVRILDITDIEVMKRMDQEAKEKLENVELIANAMMSEVLRNSSDGKALEDALAALSDMADELICGKLGVKEKILMVVKETLGSALYSSKPLRRPLHWPTEFPEVFERGGFDALVGNPPFLNGKRISTANGVMYYRYVSTYLANGIKGSADLSTFFLLRATNLVKGEHFVGLIVAKAVTEGVALPVGLHQIVKKATIVKAERHRKWIGTAGTYVCLLHFRMGQWNGVRVLDGERVPCISGDLEPGADQIVPACLAINEDLCCVGSYVLGTGFILSEEEAGKLIELDKKNQEVIFPYIGGDDVNSTPGAKATRWIINFFDWPEERAKSYKACFKILTERVLPYRMTKAPEYQRKWWQYARPGSLLRSLAAKMTRVFVGSTHTKYPVVVAVKSAQVFDVGTMVHLTDSMSFFASRESVFHECWAYRYGSTLGETLRYMPQKCFATFPFPLSSPTTDNEAMRAAGAQFHERRSDFMTKHKCGLTAVYNALNDPTVNSPEVKNLRALRREIDGVVATAYGWKDLDLGQAFYETKQGVRYTISEAARREVLDRLLALNKQRYEEEVKQGLHDETKSKAQGVSKKANLPKGQKEFF